MGKLASFAVFLLVLASVTFVASAQFLKKPGLSLAYRGKASYNKKDFAGDGHCSLGPARALNLPWKAGVVSVAINSKQYSTNPMCGLCVAIRGLNKNGPFKQKITYGIVVDECAKCKYGDIVVQGNVGGFHPVEWTAVQCAVGNSTFQYAFQGSNRFYLKLAISNTRLPIASVALKVGKTMQKFVRTTDNYWEFNAMGQPVAFPLTLVIKSFTKDVVVERLNIKAPVGVHKGKGQFPLKSAYAAVRRR